MEDGYENEAVLATMNLDAQPTGRIYTVRDNGTTTRPQLIIKQAHP